MVIRHSKLRMSLRPLPTAAAAAVAATVLASTAMAAPPQGSGGSPNATWPTGGQNLGNTRSQPLETAIGTGNVDTLAPKGSFGSGGAFLTGGGDVSATPAVDEKRLYFPASNGKLFAVDRATGSTVWEFNIAEATGIRTSNGATGDDYARATPALAGQTLIIGTQSGKFQTPDFATDHPELAGAYVLAIDKATGALLWRTKVETHFAAIVTQSAQVYGQTAFVGVASNEEAFASESLTYTCCTFRGSLVALDIKTGQIKWKTYMVPGDPGYSGSAVWGSTPAVDPQRNAVYVTTGNNYSLPADRMTCVDAAGSFEEKQACVPGDFFDAIVALDLKTGQIKWAYRTLASDVGATGPGFDFAQGPMLLRTKLNGKTTDVIGAGQKSGDFHLLNRDTGALQWRTHVGPGGPLGGLQWGSATDGKRIYVAESNSADLNTPGHWSALDPATGQELWRTYDPGTGFGYSAQGPVSVANGVVYACSLNPSGANMHAMDAATGLIKWSFASGSSCLGGAAIANGTVYWGTGYRTFTPLTTAGETLFAFTPNGG